MSAIATSTSKHGNPVNTQIGFPADTEFTGGPNTGSRQGFNPDSTGKTFADGVTKLLGTKATFARTGSVNLDMHTGSPHTTTGIPLAVGGTATVISQKVGLWLASFQDPIKAILGVGVHRDDKVIIKRKYVVGQSATITPERAPARTVAIQEDVRQVQLTRYGGDIEMNLNLFLRPEDAQEELDMKVDAQKRELERALTDIGYDMLMREGTPIHNAIMRSNPAWNPDFGKNTSMALKFEQQANRIYTSQIFGAMNKFQYPVANLLAAARYASAYSTGTQKGSVMILPHGAPDILKHARREGVEYKVTGFKQGTMHQPITMDMEEAYTDVSSGIKLLIHHPMPTYANGAANPAVSANTGLSQTVYVVSQFKKEAKLVNLESGGIVDMTVDGLKEANVRVVKLVASSAILAAPGSNTGELLVGYPFTGVSTSQAEERMRIQLRCYLGAVLYQPENVLILPNVFVEGIQEVRYYEMTPKNTSITLKDNSGNADDDIMSTHKFVEKVGADPVLAKETNGTIDGISEGYALALHNAARMGFTRATECDASKPNGKDVSNNGELGDLDDERFYMGLHGAPQHYTDFHHHQ